MLLPDISILQLFIEPELKTNRPGQRMLYSEPPDERVYEPEGVGVMVKKGEEVGYVLINLSLSLASALNCGFIFIPSRAVGSIQHGVNCGSCISSSCFRITRKR